MRSGESRLTSACNRLMRRPLGISRGECRAMSELNVFVSVGGTATEQQADRKRPALADIVTRYKG